MYDYMLPERTPVGKAFHIWPNPLISDKQFLRFHNFDIESLEAVEVWQEIARIQYLIAWFKNDEVLFALEGQYITRQNWLLKRLVKLKKREKELGAAK